jgi:hypothetical protein
VENFLLAAAQPWDPTATALGVEEHLVEVWPKHG